MSREVLEDLRECVNELRDETLLASKRLDAAEMGNAVERRRYRRLEDQREQQLSGVNGTLDEILQRLARLEVIVNGLQARKELIG